MHWITAVAGTVVAGLADGGGGGIARRVQATVGSVS
jgi:hypothetical protein